MPKSALVVRGETLSIAEICRRTGLYWEVVRACVKNGTIDVARLERRARWSAERRRLRALAKQHGVPLTVLRRREGLGWDADRAATAPVARKTPT